MKPVPHLLFLAGLTGCNVEIKDPPALPAAQSHGVLQHVHFPDRHRPRMFDDAPVEHRHGCIARRLDRIVRRVHDNRDPGDHLIDGNMMRHSAGATREDQLALIFKPLQSEAEGMHGETLLYEGSAAKHLRHENPLWGRLLSAGPELDPAPA